ncbi:CARB/PSE/RTG family carbenicillin-hydrolyzing class A beta-lactamase [uncultured Vibrio sp.]|uniref:CARB/PSE/RTG family carbenicillin-hydrolyzing class A beta-lactamase n=1 Tax=uncultured Vibrio sp. TaxID=114054 RepID=UPI0029C79F1D|nr:CARB/PSE/RTG family carbenicillin-hydrolyzing class A beta-lactamase [uncultured Vibrio sp.]
MRKLLFLIALMVVSPLSHASKLHEDISLLEQQITGRIGIAVWDTQTDKHWAYRGDERFPLVGTVKTLACATMLNEMDTGILRKNATAAVEKHNMVMWSPILDKLSGQNVRIEHACEAAMLMNDNTATNLVLNEIGGPKSVTLFLRTIGDKATRLDRIAPGVNEAMPGDKHDTTTPNAIVNTLETLIDGDALSYESRTQLKIWMQDSKVSDSLMRSVLPSGWSIADRSGSGGNGSLGFNAVIWKENHKPVYISIYVAETELSLQAREQLIAHISQLILYKYQNF